MKKQLTVALGLAVLATPVFASKARLQALGEDNYGSQYINDNRNIWLNAAQITNHKDLITYEFGTENTADDAATPRGEAGINKAYGNLVYGLHLGGASTTANAMRANSGLTGADEENNIDVFVGGDAGLKWGANLGYARASNEVRANGASSESMRSRLGVIMGDTQAYANVNLINWAKGTDATVDKFEGDLGYQIGVIHAMNGNTLFADYRSFDGENEIAGVKNDISVKRLEVGFGRVERLNDRTNLFAKASYVMAETENERLAGVAAGQFNGGACDTGNAALSCEEYETSQIPVVIGIEADATSWLTLRASVGQTIWGSEEDKNNERSIVDSTEINAGATLKFGELVVDGVIGNDTDGNTTAADGTDSGTIRTDSLMSRVSMTYRF
ncbi:MAG: hypothetical protein ACLGHN_09960 [Bacteriovoracia bacterium]